MTTVEYIRGEVKKLYEGGSDVHLRIRVNHSKSSVNIVTVKISGVYSNIFAVKEMGASRLNRHSFQYGEILTGQIVIEELDYFPALDQKQRSS